jgi:hypothetical protein
VNREYSVAELKILLEKAEQELEDKRTHIELLENIIKEGGLNLPTNLEDRIKEVVA